MVRRYRQQVCVECRAAAYVKLGLFADALTDAEVATSIQPTLVSAAVSYLLCLTTLNRLIWLVSAIYASFVTYGQRSYGQCAHSLSSCVRMQ